ncbi:DUF1993 family protein [Psychrosphaera algicola]|uniref:DUF1993 family protein n=1 Tax=Psychrosphaera algicola TaxID=3023714 RepID=A0ABT5FD11_9GAMM|nr:DUF1993 family protein [Psychrosphaera sp. G1-22]MDC2889024.1 DUF1993 family protein [Psychrosphaera sp. G1-22]
MWCAGEDVDSFNPEVTSMATAKEVIQTAKTLVENITVDDAPLEQVKRISLGKNMDMELVGTSYLNDFLVPNLYFHLTTAYNILRLNGVDIGKKDFMINLAPHVQLIKAP